MEWFEFRRKTKLHNNNTWLGVPIQRKLYGPWPIKSHNNTEKYHHRKRNKYNLNLYTIAATCLSLITTTPSFATDVGGVSATANPIANSSGSVTNQAIQVMQGPYITNTYGGGIPVSYTHLTLPTICSV